MSGSRRFYTVLRITKSGFINLFRNAWLTIAATAVMVVALTIILLAVVLNSTANNAIDELAKNLKASVYLVDGLPDSDRNSLQAGVSTLDFVESIEVVSAEQAKEDLAGEYNNDDSILQALALAGEDALPASLRITVTDLERMFEIEEFVNQDEYKDSVSSVSLGQSDAQATIDKAASAQGFITNSSIISAGVLSIVSIMIIFNTIRMAIYTRRDEIRIMKLIGATPDYIRGPFLVEASLYGVVAGIVSNAVVYSLVFSLGKKVADQPEFSQTYAFFTQPNIIVVMLIGAILLGILIGAVSSMLAMERHLKLKNW